MHGNLSVVALDDFLSEGEAEPVSVLFLCGEEGLEDLGAMSGGNAVAVICDDELNFSLPVFSGEQSGHRPAVVRRER